MHTSKDVRYQSVKVLIETGNIKSIREIFQFIPKTTVYKDLGINFNRFDRAILNPAIFRVQELITLAGLFNIDPKKFIDMAYEQFLATSTSNNKVMNRVITRL